MESLTLVKPFFSLLALILMSTTGTEAQAWASPPNACYPHGNTTDVNDTAFEFIHTVALEQIQNRVVETVRSRFAPAMRAALSTSRAPTNSALSVAESIENWLDTNSQISIPEAAPFRNALIAYKNDVQNRLAQYENLDLGSADLANQRVLTHTLYLEKSRATVEYFNLRNAMEAFAWSSGVQNTFARMSICPQGTFHPSEQEAQRQAIRFEFWIQRDRLLNPSEHERVRGNLLDESTFEYRFAMRTNLPATGPDLVAFARNDLTHQPHSVGVDIEVPRPAPAHESSEQADHREHRREYLERYLDFTSRHIPLKQFYINQCLNGRGNVRTPTLTFSLSLNLNNAPKIILSSIVTTEVQLLEHNFDVVITNTIEMPQLDPSENESFGRFNTSVENVSQEASPGATLYSDDYLLNTNTIEDLWFHLHPECQDRPVHSERQRTPRHHGHHRRRY